MKKIWTYPLAAALTAALSTAVITGCAPDSSPAPSSAPVLENAASPSLTLEERFNELYYATLKAQENKNAIGLTREQMLEDYDYLYRALEENYPYIGVARRKAGADLRANYKEGRLRLETCETDLDFYLEVSGLINSMKGIGHLSLPNAGMVLREVNGYRDMMESGTIAPDMEWYKPWIDDYLSPPAAGHAAQWDALLTDAFDSAYSQTMEEFGMDQEVLTENVKTCIIDKGKTAYISISGFDMGLYDQDKETLFAFYRQVADYDNLIIDITQNGGGGMAYYQDLIVAPNIDHDIYWLNYSFLKDGPIIRRYHPDIEAYSFKKDTPPEQIRERILEGFPEEQRPAIEPLLTDIAIPPKMNRDDLIELDLYSPDIMYIKSMNGEKMFNGKIWVLVSENVYSSSESFASFCKTTGFAPLAGTRTGGDGIGSDPLLYVLPNSGLVGRFAWIYGTVQDGTGSEEFGTEPDYISKEGETALDTCLRIIDEEAGIGNH